jgi:hypothetical protein
MLSCLTHQVVICRNRLLAAPHRSTGPNRSTTSVCMYYLHTNCLKYNTCPGLAGRSSRDYIPIFSAQRSILRLRLVVFLQELMVLVATNACSELLRRVCEINMEAICLRLGNLLYLTHLHLLSKTSPRAHFTSNLQIATHVPSSSSSLP